LLTIKVLPVWAAAAVFAFGMFGYYIFRSVNNQKDLVRLTDGKCLIWGKPPKVIRTKYRTSDGKEHSSILLASGWWGLARHFNYTGDLILSFAMCAACGFGHFLPWFYFFYMFILLEQRIHRDDVRCSGTFYSNCIQYGNNWRNRQIW
jgi:7-dehydrocholesterol reductase